MTKPKTTARKRKPAGTRGPPADDTVKRMAQLSRDWRHDAEETLLALQSKLRERVQEGSLTTFELIGAIRTIGETLTSNQALIPAPKPATDPSAP